jgi:hypothetical protein
MRRNMKLGLYRNDRRKGRGRGLAEMVVDMGRAQRWLRRDGQNSRIVSVFFRYAP